MNMASCLHIEPQWASLFETRGLDRVSTLLDWETGTVVERESNSEVRRVSVVDRAETEETFYLKKYFVRNWKTFRNNFFQGAYFGQSKARREFSNLKLLRDAGLDTPEPIAYAEEKAFGKLIRCCLVTKEIPASKNLDEYFLEVLPGLTPEVAGENKTRLLKTLAATARKMHQSRFVHRDFFCRNILIQGGSLERLFILDAPKGRRWPRCLLGSKPEADLATLDAAAMLFFRRTQRLRFYLDYCDISKLTAGHKLAIRRILQLAGPQRARQIRRLELRAADT